MTTKVLHNPVLLNIDDITRLIKISAQMGRKGFEDDEVVNNILAIGEMFKTLQ